MIINHTQRLSHVGKVCSGAFLTKDQKNDALIAADYLISRGNFLLGLLIVYWIFFAIILLSVCFLVIFLIKK